MKKNRLISMWGMMILIILMAPEVSSETEELLIIAHKNASGNRINPSIMTLRFFL